MSNVSQWETSAPNNDAAPPNGAPEGMAANTVNDTMREMMAATARWFQDINGSLVTGGAGDSYTLTTNNNNASLTDLPLVVFVANRANSGAATLNVDGLGAKSLRFGGVALAAGVLQEDVAYIAIYNAEDDAFDIVGYPTRDASQITTGTLPDARLSSNVPLKNAANVFTVQQTIRSGSPSLTVERIGSAVNAAIEAKTTDGSVYFGNSNGSTFAIGATNNLVPAPWVSVSSTEFRVNAALLDFNGNADISGTLAVGGAATFMNTQSIERSAGEIMLALRRTNAPANTGRWYYGINASGVLSVGGLTDAGASVGAAITATHDDDSITSLTLAADAITVTGPVTAGTAATSTSSTLAAGQIHHRSENTTVPSMSAGQWVAVQNTSTSSITLSEGSGVTLELGGTTTTGNRTLLAKGFAFIYFRANGVGVVHGNGVV